MKHTHLSRSVRSGFSLVEMLIVITIIALIAAIAIPNIGNTSSAAQASKNRRNAQTITSVFMSGAAAGVTWNTASLDAAIADVIAGKAPVGGAFSGRVFKVPSIDAENQTGAKTHLRLSANNEIEYVQ
jgi:type IV pilus assembly protein PilA